MEATSWIFFILMLSCITPYSPPTTYTTSQLVVNGMITDQPGPYQVVLGMTAAASTANGNTGHFPANARVFILDNRGTQEELTDNGNGIFLSSAGGIRGMIGNSYKVVVVLQEGSRYESTPELLKPVSPIDTIYSIYKDQPAGLRPIGKFSVNVQTYDSKSSGDYYRWTWKHFEYKPLCWTIPTARHPCCDRCWDVVQCENCITIFSDYLSNGVKINQHLLDIPYDSKDPYYLRVEQFSISEGAYKFWKGVNDQINSVGGVFDPPPAAVQGNLFNVVDTKEQVLGFFSASAVSQKIIYVSRANVGKEPIPPIAYYQFGVGCLPCVESYFRTKTQPEGWVE